MPENQVSHSTYTAFLFTNASQYLSQPGERSGGASSPPLFTAKDLKILENTLKIIEKHIGFKLSFIIYSEFSRNGLMGKLSASSYSLP